MTVVAGLDGCRGGWLCLWGDPENGRLAARILHELEELTFLEPRPRVVGADIPIGLPERGVRTCDRAARRLLGRPRSSSVFPPPIRPMLEASSHAEACRIGDRIHGSRLSRQAWNILPKIREMDAFLVAGSDRPGWVREVHPEVSFAVWNGGAPMTHNKRSVAGGRERAALVEGYLGGRLDRARADLPPDGFAGDDLLDAVAVLWTARRIAAGRAVRLPEDPERDAGGLPMEILA
ncbi:DUF429 domain-containing protein [Thiohalorhabdus methylotrophus]|uniref:DUF429 domain-containing protein n=1 Tax=Thiohalorhabdus methylotrophus TaxID=3242694 RepID=A0ABV4U0W8_9GAMM